MGKKNQTDSICWLCNRACGGCSWADEFIPVEGWTAEKTTVYGGAESYCVIACPLFEKPEEGCGLDWRKMDDEGCVLLIKKLMELTHDDYVQSAREETRREIERFIRGKGASRLHRISDPESVIKALQQQRLQYWRSRISLVRGGH